MLPVSESWSLIILGSWNPSIFTSEWIIKYLSNDDKSKIEIAFNLLDPTAPRKITFDEITLYPGRKQISITPINPTIDGMLKAASILNKILSLLSHTPVAQAGINFTFSDINKEVDELDPPEEISNSYIVNDNSITRSLAGADNDYLLKYTLNGNSDGCIISFNFHYEKSNIDYYKELFQEETIRAHFKEALHFSKTYYDLDLEEIKAED